MIRRLALVLACVGVALFAATIAQRVDLGEEIAYGSHPEQTFDYWPGRGVAAPLVVFVHGGGWSQGDKRMMQNSDKLSHWRKLGYAVASLNYRLVPAATVEQQAADIAAAVALLKTRTAPRKIAIIGHSAGAHLVALVGTDPAYLRGAGLAFADIAGVVPLDGAAYHVPSQFADGPRIMIGRYRRAFGTDPARQAQLSPTVHAAAPNAGQFLILHVQRPDGIAQSERLGAELRRAGTAAEVHGFAGTGLRGHAEINRRMGDEDYPATAVLDRFLAEVLR